MKIRFGARILITRCYKYFHRKKYLLLRRVTHHKLTDFGAIATN